MKNLSDPTFLLTGDDERYYHPGDVTRRLQDTIVRFNGELIWIYHTSELSVTFAYLAEIRNTVYTHKPFNEYCVNANDSRLDISSIPLGMVSIPLCDNPKRTWRTVYVMRAPLRMQKQGVHLSSVMYYDCNQGSYQQGISNDYNTMAGIYDSYSKQFKTIQQALDGTDSAALSRSFALSEFRKLKVLNFRGQNIGVFVDKTRRFVIQKRKATPFCQKLLHNLLSKQDEYYEVQYRE